MSRLSRFIHFYTDEDEGQGGGDPGIEKTIKAALIHITDALAKPAKKLVAYLNPIQDLNGQDSPYPAGGGKNKLQNIGSSGTHRGVSAIFNADGTISVSGTNDGTSYSYFMINNMFQTENGVSYIISGAVSSNILIRDVTAAVSDTGSGVTIVGDGQMHKIELRILTSYAITGTVTVKPMICLSTATKPLVFSPYSNICPITGWTGVDVTRTGKNLYDKLKAIKLSTNLLLGSPTTTSNPDGSFVLPAGTYTFSVSESMTGIYATNKSGENIKTAYNTTSMTFTNPEKQPFKLMLYKAGANVDYWDTVNVQLELGSTATSYEPFSGTTIPITFPVEAGTVYSGTLDVTSGKLSVNKRFIDIGSLSDWQKSSHNVGTIFRAPISDKKDGAVLLLCSSYAYKENKGFATPQYCISDSISLDYSKTIFVNDPSMSAYSGEQFKEAISGVKLVYELATPIEYDLTPTQVQLLLGENNLWSNSNGDLELTYLARATE